MSSTWICSRNDLIANVGVILAAVGCYVSTSRWPDIVVGGVIAALFLSSSFSVLRQAVRQLRAPPISTSKPISVAIRFSKSGQ